MPAFLVGLLKGLGGALLSLASSLLTEKVLKKAVIVLLEKVVAKTENTTDDELLKIAKEAWGSEDSK